MGEVWCATVVACDSGDMGEDRCATAVTWVRKVKKTQS
nr:hypothetical protein Itr_chr05CG10130 [Ipomoea trifida]GLL34294.1 hypothetical protein Itr_chr08CG21520 [Ipomoea trifida]GLL42038.1 hypothetical protein Itr_chr12CG16620 [Ipomoea trifida]